MINKQSLWFITLFSLIIVLGIYYFSTDQTSLTMGKYQSSSSYVANSSSDDNNISVLKVADDESTMGKIDELQNILLDDEATLEEKNNAYESLQSINTNKGKEEEIENLIKKEFNLNSFVKISGDKISITIASDDHDVKKANDIIIKVQDLYQERMFITIRFQK